MSKSSNGKTYTIEVFSRDLFTVRESDTETGKSLVLHGPFPSQERAEEARELMIKWDNWDADADANAAQDDDEGVEQISGYYTACCDVFVDDEALRCPVCAKRARPAPVPTKPSLEALRAADRALSKLIAAQHAVHEMNDQAEHRLVGYLRGEVARAAEAFNYLWLGLGVACIDEILVVEFGDEAKSVTVRWNVRPSELKGTHLRGWLFDQINAAELAKRGYRGGLASAL